MLHSKSWQRTKTYAFAVIVLSILLFSIFSSLRLWLHQLVRLSNTSSVTVVSIQKQAWHGEQYEITLNKKRFDIHHIEQGKEQITLYGEWDTAEDEILKQEKNQHGSDVGFSGISPFLFCSDLPQTFAFYPIKPTSVLNGINRCHWLENYLPPTNPPPDMI